MLKNFMEILGIKRKPKREIETSIKEQKIKEIEAIEEGKIKHCFSNNAVLFIKKYAIPYLNIVGDIDNDDVIIEIEGIARDWEDDMVDKDGSDKEYDYPEKERNELADKFIGEVYSVIEDENEFFDYDDLNKRLKEFKE